MLSARWAGLFVLKQVIPICSQMLALLGVEFDHPDVVGAVVQVRSKEDVLSVWLSDKNPKFRVGYVDRAGY